MEKILAFLIFACLFNHSLAQDTLIIDEKYLEGNIWNEIDQAPPYVSAVELDYSKDWTYEFAINDTIEINEKVFYVFTLQGKNLKENKYEFTTFIVNQIDDKFYSSHLVFNAANFSTGLSPRDEIHSVLIDGRLTVYYLDEIIETINLGEDGW